MHDVMPLTEGSKSVRPHSFYTGEYITVFVTIKTTSFVLLSLYIPQ